MTALLVIGILLAAGGGAGYVYANGNLNDGDFWWDHYGTRSYTDMVQTRDLSMYALIGGGILIFVALIFLAVKKANQGKAVNVTVSAPAPGAAAASVAAAAAPAAAPAPAGGVCPGCGAPVKPGQRFCGKCGRDLTQKEKRVCSACGTELGADDVFCPGCGAKYES